MADQMLKTIYLSSLEFLRPVGLTSRYRIAIEQAVKVVGADHGSLFLGNKSGQLERVFSNVPKGSQTQPRKHGFAQKSYENGKLYVVSPKTLEKVHKPLFDNGVKSLVIIPLSFNNVTIGVIALQCSSAKKMNTITKNELNLFGSLISLGIRNSQLYEITLEAVESRDLFISLASHELKTPLTTIAAYSDLIAKKVKTKVIPSEKSVDVLNAEVKRLKHMLNELLAIDQIKTGQLSYNFKDISIIHNVKRAIINFKFSYPGYKVFIENSLPQGFRTIQGDEEKLQQAITNLLNNSAKFSSNLTPIVISLNADESSISISITDYGKGIRKKEQNKVFTEFFKASGNRKEGMGLGLYLVKSIIEKHGGTIALLSKLNKGTTITIRIPKKLYE